MKATWQGYIALGQLGIPAKLYSASRSIRPQFVQLHEKDSSPVERAAPKITKSHTKKLCVPWNMNQDVILL
jgi:non-homologous end joining protein Ku